ncbi:RNAse P Rpr2/Rpp21/SNM1 subunit domain-containing protein [Apiospora rasikravindrae]|uniref:RNAse P Rpr2/Rpp21/SNM1 subunit domain-containing protein n=1 Tax=Apiospora rasikravindrae TaxID=990691 RepID=A0ABR1SWD2_9PEZI
MEKETLEPSLRFLTDAAHLLAKTAPETSAHIMAKRNAYMFENNLELSDRQREHICGACGHIMVPGAGDALKFETDKAIRKSRSKKGAAVTKPDARKSGRESGIRKVITCKMCDRYTKLNFPPPPSIVRRAKAKPIAATTATGLPAAPGAKATAAQASEPAKALPPSANASSKKRAKNRKQGLQALLQSQAASSAPKVGLGLSLADFMKK